MTTATSASLPAVASHGLAAPTLTDLRESLRRVVKTDWDAFWTAACRAGGVSPAADAVDLQSLQAVADHIIAGGGVAAVMARSTTVRVRTYRQLAK